MQNVCIKGIKSRDEMCICIIIAKVQANQSTELFMLPPCLLHFCSFFLHILQTLIRAYNIYRYWSFSQTTWSTTTSVRWWYDQLTTRTWFRTMFWRRRLMLRTTLRRWFRWYGRHSRFIWFTGHMFLIARWTGWRCWAWWFSWWCNWRWFHFVLTMCTIPSGIVIVCIGFGYLRIVAFLMIQRLTIRAFD